MKRIKICSFLILFLFNLHGFAQENIYADDIGRFLARDSIDPPPAQAILFVGSSSFTRWNDVQDYFPGYVIINRGFGGSTLSDQIRYADQIIIPYKPRQIVIYCGENDIAYGDTVTPDMVIDRFKTLFFMIRSELPDVEITYISMKPSPSRWNLADRMMEGNEGIREFLSSQKNTSYINVWDEMLNQQGRPDGSLFMDDSLHMNVNGYLIWQERIKPKLVKN